jgi:hypothetical protein
MTRRLLGVAAALSAAALLSGPDALGSPYGAHAQLYACCTPLPAMEALFREAKDAGLSSIRVDVAMDVTFGGPRPDWRGTDAVLTLSRRYRLPVLVVLSGTPPRLTSCPTEPLERQRLCPPLDLGSWALGAAALAERYSDRIHAFEIWNEPDARWSWLGTPVQYGALLSAAYSAIKEVAPDATVLDAGVPPTTAARAWLARAFLPALPDAAERFDVASVHLRGQLERLAAGLGAWRSFMRAFGRRVPFWVTEHGYAADSAHQRDPGFRGGEAAQAAYLRRSLPLLRSAGVARVFVTLRDNPALGGDFRHEGILAGSESAPRRRPAWYAVRAAALYPR